MPPRSAAAPDSALHTYESFNRLCLRELPGSVEDFLPRAVEADHIVPARRDRQAVGSLAVAPAELDGNRAVLTLLRCEVVDRVGVLLVRLEVSLGVVDADRLYHTYLGPHEGRRRAAWHVREQPNLYLETSWCSWQTVVELVETVGAERVLFGSDASVDGPHHYCRHPPNVEGRETYNQGLVSLVRALGARAARQVLGENARRLFGLDHPS